MLYTVLVLGATLAFMTLSVWQVEAQLRFLREYQRASGAGLDLLNDDVLQPSKWLANAPRKMWMIFRADTRPLVDPKLEALRRTYLLRRRVWALASVALLVILALAPVVLPR